MNKIEIEAEEFKTSVYDVTDSRVGFKTILIAKPRDSGKYLQTDNLKTGKFENNIKEKYQKKNNYIIITDDGCVYMKNARLEIIGYTEKGVKIKCLSGEGHIPIWAQDKEELEKELI